MSETAKWELYVDIEGGSVLHWWPVRTDGGDAGWEGREEQPKVVAYLNTLEADKQALQEQLEAARAALQDIFDQQTRNHSHGYVYFAARAALDGLKAAGTINAPSMASASAEPAPQDDPGDKDHGLHT